jgi:hypothetical protein
MHVDIPSSGHLGIWASGRLLGKILGSGQNTPLTGPLSPPSPVTLAHHAPWRWHQILRVVTVPNVGSARSRNRVIPELESTYLQSDQGLGCRQRVQRIRSANVPEMRISYVRIIRAAWANSPPGPASNRGQPTPQGCRAWADCATELETRVFFALPALKMRCALFFCCFGWSGKRRGWLTGCAQPAGADFSVFGGLSRYLVVAGRQDLCGCQLPNQQRRREYLAPAHTPQRTAATTTYHSDRKHSSS